MRWDQLVPHAPALGFTPREQVRWLAPGELWRTAVKVALSSVFVNYLDKREMQGTLDPRRMVIDPDAEGGCWLDFVADLGDGFDATYSVATLLARPELELPGLPDPLPRGTGLVLGGDEVYPTPSAAQYEDRLRGPYRAALPVVEGDPPLLLALPGNHDWYDGLTAFVRLFGQRRDVGGWRTAQSRSYFVLQLPQRWWLVGLDTQLGTDIDEPQRLFFRQHLTAQLQPGDGVIVCAPAPTWVYSNEHRPDDFNTLHYFDRKIVRLRQEAPGAPPVPTGAAVRLWLTGDRHHYARYVPEQEFPGGAPPPQAATRGEQMVTCGLGGAYLASTHTLPETLTLPPAQSRYPHPDPGRFRLASRYPDAPTSRRLGLGLLAPTARGIAWRNRGFWRLVGGVHAALFLVLAGVLGLFLGQTPAHALRTATVGDVWQLAGQLGVWFAVVVAGWTLRPVLHRHLPRFPVLATIGIVFQMVLAFATLSVVVLVPWPDGTPDWVLLGACVVGTVVVTGLAACYAFAGTILLARRGQVAELRMSGQAIEDHKGFLRIRVHGDGRLTVHPVAIDRICRDWTLEPSPGTADLRPVPAMPLRPRLIEPPFEISRTP